MQIPVHVTFNASEGSCGLELLQKDRSLDE